MPHLTPPVSFVTMLRYLGYQEREDDPSGSYLHVWVEPPPVLPKQPAPKPEESPPMPTPAPAPDLIAASDVAARLQKAFTRKAQEEARPALSAVEALHDDLANYAKAIQQQAEEKALSAMLASVGEETPTPTDLTGIQTKLRTSLMTLLELVGGGPFAHETAKEPAVSDHPTAPDNDIVDEAPDSEPQTFDPEDVKAVLARVEALSNNRWKEHPNLRLLPLLQAYTAEVRHWQGQIPSTSHLHWQLGQSVKLLAAVKYDAAIKDFIQGLAQDAQGDWLKIAADAYAQIRKFDKDAARPLQDKKSGPTPKLKEVEPAAPSHQWPSLPHLRTQTKKLPLVFIGGIPVPNKIENVYERFGFEVEWVEVYRGKGDATAANRISNGTVGAVVILEKFLGHKTSEKLVEGCKARGIPWAFGGNAGTATLQRALEALDGKIAA